MSMFYSEEMTYYIPSLPSKYSTAPVFSSLLLLSVMTTHFLAQNTQEEEGRQATEKEDCSYEPLKCAGEGTAAAEAGRHIRQFRREITRQRIIMAAALADGRGKEGERGRRSGPRRGQSPSRPQGGRSAKQRRREKMES